MTTEKVSIEQILQRIDASASIENNLREVLSEFLDDYVNEMIRMSCALARHRGSTQLQAKDVYYAIEHYFAGIKPASAPASIVTKLLKE